MAVFAVYCPRRATPEQRPEALRFVPERPSLWAFLLPPLWLVAHRLWLALLVWIVATGAVVALTRDLAPGPAGAVLLVFWLWFAWSARDIEQASLARAGWTLEAVIEARGRAEAERRFFEARAAFAPPPLPERVYEPPTRLAAAGVVGFEGFGERGR